MTLTREAILASSAPKVEEVGPVPGWGGNVHIRHITVQARNEWADLRYRALDGDRVDVALLVESRLHLVASCLCDEKGERLFTLDEVRELDPHAVDYVANEAERLNGLTAEAADEIKGNSEAPQDDADSSS